MVLFTSFFIKPVFDYGANLQFVKGNRGEEVEVRDIADGFSSKELYIDIILTNLIVLVSIILGFICLVFPGIYIFCRLVLSSYLVIDKGLAPKQAASASWQLMRDDWPKVILLGLVSIGMCIIGILLLFVGIFPAIVWIKSMFASFYQQIFRTSFLKTSTGLQMYNNLYLIEIVSPDRDLHFHPKYLIASLLSYN